MKVELGELEKGLKSTSKIWEEIGQDEVDYLVEKGHMVASAFVHWEGVDEEGKRKGRFVENFKPHKKWGWGDGSVRMDKPAEFAAQVEKGDSFLSFDIKAGYRHFFLHPSVRNFFLFHYGGRYFRCIALPFAWCRSAFYFVNLLKPFVGKIRRWGSGVLPYIDDFLVAPAIGRPSTGTDCLEISLKIDGLMRKIGLQRHDTKGVWGEGACIVDHLGFKWDSVRLLFTVTAEKQQKVRTHAREFLIKMARGRGWVSRDSLRSFAGVATSLHLALPLALFYTRAIHHVVSEFSEARKPAS